MTTVPNVMTDKTNPQKFKWIDRKTSIQISEV